MMNQIRVFKATKKRANEFAMYTASDGTRHVHVPRDLLEWADAAAPPEDYSEATYYCNETDDAPYVSYTKKSDEMIVKYQAKVMADKIEQLWASADKYVSGYISGVAVGLLTIGVLQQKPKSLAITAWSQAIWSEYYVRKAGVTFDSVLDLDFSPFGPIPHSIPDLQAEVLGQ